MSTDDDRPTCPWSRRAFLTQAASVAAGAAAAVTISPPAAASPPAQHHLEPFWGVHQAGITTPLQQHVYFAAFDLITSQRAEVVSLLQAWTQAAARMCRGETAQSLDQPLRSVGVEASHGEPTANYGTYAPSVLSADSGEALGLTPARLTVTFGFGPSLFLKDGQDRYGIAAQRPPALVDLPRFPGDQLVAERTGGDLAIQACADDPQVVFHAIRQLARVAANVAQIRWVQSGFTPHAPLRQTPRNLMGFKDGTNNPSIRDPPTMQKYVWVGGEGPEWMQGGSYLVARRIRVALEHWDRMNIAFQERTVGRHKYSGAPLSSEREFEPLDLAATDHDGNPVIPENSHVRLAAPASNDGVQILRRPYSYNDGVNFTAERWPPWRQGMEYDAGLFFLAYQRDPRTGFIKIYDKMSRFDMMNQFVTHVGGGLFACPRGATPTEFIGQRLFETV